MASRDDAPQPFRVQLLALIFLQEHFARNLVGLGQAHEPAFERVEPLVDVVELLDQRLDARIVERQRLHIGDDLIAQLLVAALLRGRERGLVADFLVLQLAQRLVGLGDAVEGLEHLRLELGFHRRERDARIVVLVVIFFLDLRLVEIFRREHVAIIVIAAARRGGGRRSSRRGSGFLIGSGFFGSASFSSDIGVLLRSWHRGRHRSLRDR